MENFSSFNLHTELVQALEQLQFVTPTPIQAQVIPLALQGQDILGFAPTGMGKTAAFGVPIVNQLLNHPEALALVMVPTRELATQVMMMLTQLLGSQTIAIKTATLIGGEPIEKQLRRLKARPRLIVGTPGRIYDHLTRKTLNLQKLTCLVLDEADRMLDMGFAPQIESIMQFVPETRQTFLFSATLPKSIMVMSKKYLNQPACIALAPTATPPLQLKQETLFTSEAEKFGHLTAQLEQREGSIMVFVKTKMGAERIAKQLREKQHLARAIHGDLSHHQRQRAIHGFRESHYRIMVATDLAARGLDIAHVRHVINYDLPQCSEDYVHRIGRTARAGAEGSALCLITPADRSKWHAIDRMLNPDQARAAHAEEGSARPPRRYNRPRAEGPARRGRTTPNRFKDKRKSFFS